MVPKPKIVYLVCSDPHKSITSFRLVDRVLQSLFERYFDIFTFLRLDWQMASGSSREEITRNFHTSMDGEGPDLVTFMREKIDKMPLLSPNCCIYRVPKRLRQVNEKAYTPLVVSIGPLHHGKQGLEAMEEHKWRYLRDFLEHSQKSIAELVEFVREREEKIRECYAETISLSSDKFVKIVLVDAAFIIELFLRGYRPARLRTDDDRIFRKPWMINDIRSDLLLLENQIPLFVFEDFFSMINISETCTFMELTREFLARSRDLTMIAREEKFDVPKSEHFIDFQRSCLIARESTMSQQCTTTKKYEPIRTAIELNEAGVKFKASSSKNLFAIKFSRGVLEIPHIRITDGTERNLRNLLAFEQCHCGSRYMSNYVSIMDRLINTSKDVELLVHKGVIETWLGDSQDVSNLFNNLAKNNLLNPNNFHFGQLCKDLNDHCRIPCNKWKAALRHDYFKTPWQVLSIGVAASLLLLTFIQTVCSIISVGN